MGMSANTFQMTKFFMFSSKNPFLRPAQWTSPRRRGLFAALDNILLL